ncbi:hypothetical protein BDN67DRAFT_1008030 [Paxillus ammoniavirescens]|nr:hypothetical protein BDN67DRAFT_1008030 [Paxillus ammoniavirescens]
MPAIFAPSPRLAPRYNTLQSEILSHEVQPDHRPFSHSMAPLQTITSRNFLSSPRLLSPIILNEPPYVALNAKSPTPCGSAHKRRVPSRPSRSMRRRRHMQRVDCPFDSFGRASVLDQLPWISALEMPRGIGCDIADLSQIPVNEDLDAFSEAVPASGPVRRRKTSLRSNPFGNGHEAPNSEVPSRQLFPLHRPTDRVTICPKTPPPRIPFDPSRVIFHNLMPVFPHDLNPGSCFRGLPSSP